MALRSLTTRMCGPAAAYALRQPPGTGVVLLPGPPPAPALSRFLNTSSTQGKRVVKLGLEYLLNELKRIQQEDAAYMLEAEYLLAELEKATNIAKQHAVELEQVRRLKKKARMIYGFTLVALPCMTVYLARLQ